MFHGSNNVIAGLVAAATAIAVLIAATADSTVVAIVFLVVGGIASLSPRVVKEWERGVILRLGRFRRIAPPGVTWVAPGFDQFAATVDMRIRSTPFSAEKSLTKDTVPVNVDAVLFWVVIDAEKAILEVEQYLATVSWAAQTTLRDVIGQTDLVRMISDREAIDRELQETIDAKTADWGITVQSVEIRDVRIPASLEDAMSRKAQAEREKEARIILAESELKVAEEMLEAAHVYESDHVALQLRAMNMTYESIKERGALMVIPTGMAESINTGVMGMAATGFRFGAETAHSGDGQ